MYYVALGVIFIIGVIGFIARANKKGSSPNWHDRGSDIHDPFEGVHPKYHEAIRRRIHWEKKIEGAQKIATREKRKPRRRGRRQRR